MAKAEIRSRIIRLPGLESSKKYQVGNILFTGEILINAGLRVDAESGDFRSKLIEITAVE